MAYFHMHQGRFTSNEDFFFCGIRICQGSWFGITKQNSSENMIGKFTFERILIQIEVEIEWMMKDVLQNNSLVCIEYMFEDEEEGISIEVFHNNLFLS